MFPTNDLEYQKYKNFMVEYFPKSPIPNFEAYSNKIFQYSIQNINFIRLISKLDSHADQEQMELYKTFEILHLRTLYHLPSNDNFIDKIIIRALTENILRLTVRLLNYQHGNINKLSYSEIIEYLEGKGIQHRYKDFYAIFTNYFGKFSKDVHGFNIPKISTQDYLINIRIIPEEKHLLEISKVYENINKLFIPLFLKETTIKKTDLPSAELSKLLTIVGEENYSIFYER